MKRILLFLFFSLILNITLFSQTGLKRVYDEEIDQMKQIDQALTLAQSDGKFVICQLGGNWCPWCLKFADFIEKDTTISNLIDENFVYIHVNYRPNKKLPKEKAEVTE